MGAIGGTYEYDVNCIVADDGLAASGGGVLRNRLSSLFLVSASL
jgi:hypothetical protein